MSRPETIENRWDVLYRDYPDVYERFSSFPYEPDVMDVLLRTFDVRSARVADVGAGTGRSTLALARHAASVVGVEPEEAMRNVALERAAAASLDNIEFRAGTANDLPLADASVDVVVAITATLYPAEEVRPFVREAVRVLRPGGRVVVVDIAPGWYGGELHSLIADADADAGDVGLRDRYLVGELGFSSFDVDTIQRYGSVENVAETYGFIFGRRTIEHVRSVGLTSIRWRFRFHHRTR